MSNTNDVRQVLMNELGLTRESIRKEMEQIVASTMEKHLRSEQFQRTVDRVVGSTLDAYLKQGNYDRDMLKRVVGESVQKHLMSRLEISVKVKS